MDQNQRKTKLNNCCFNKKKNEGLVQESKGLEKKKKNKKKKGYRLITGDLFPICAARVWREHQTLFETALETNIWLMSKFTSIA